MNPLKWLHHMLRPDPPTRTRHPEIVMLESEQDRLRAELARLEADVIQRRHELPRQERQYG